LSAGDSIVRLRRGKKTKRKGSGERVHDFESMWPPSYPLTDDPERGRARETAYRKALASKDVQIEALLPGGDSEAANPEVEEAV
jgi:hypothetical protein